MQQEQNELKTAVEHTIRQSLIKWAIRWSIGIIAVIGITSYKPGLTWIWYVVAPVALLSLGAIFATKYLMEQELQNDEDTNEDNNTEA